jgi:quercetin dioxygenase-like cupin family protein
VRELRGVAKETNVSPVLPRVKRAVFPKSSPMSSVTWYRWTDMPRETVSPMLDRRLITCERMMIAQVYLKKGCVVPKHSHENEQITYIVEGGLRFWIGDDQSEVIDVRAGEVLTIPSNVPHKAEALEDTLDVDIFNPPRQDWLQKTDAYLRK